MLSILILICLLWNFYIGYNRGILLQAFYLVGAIISLVVANNHYQKWAEKISLWIPYSNPAEGVTMSFFTNVNIFHLNKVYYAGIAFFAFFVISYAIFRLIGVFVHFLPIDYFDDWRFNTASGLMAVCVALMFFTMILSILATIPMPMIQEQLHSHFVTRLLVEHCPPMTQVIKNFWITKVI